MPFDTTQTKWIALYLALIAIGCSPVWGVEYFVSHDGSTHLYNAYLMGRLVQGDPTVQQYLQFNTIAVPNSTGHWLLAGMLQIVGPVVATKLISTLTFAGIVGSAGWLRWRTNGTNGVRASLVFGAVLAFNWLWFLGFYNFTIGLIGFAFTVGLYYGWSGRMSAWRTIVLAILVLLVYWSHIVSFAMLSGTLLLIAFLVETSDRKRTLLLTAAAVIPVIPLILIFRSVNEIGVGFSPTWRFVNSFWSIRDWVVQLTAADPFVLISRRTLPFVSITSSWFFIVAPLFLTMLGCISLAIGSLRKGAKRFLSRPVVVFSIAFVGSMAVAALSPDHFGLENGSLLRERILLCGSFFFIPLFVWDKKALWTKFGVAAFAIVFLFQTAALWEYSLKTTATAKEFLSVKEDIPDGAALVTVIVLRDRQRFHSVPELQLISYVGIDRDIRVWDNYEIAHYLFPVVTRDPADRAFIFELTQSLTLDLNDPEAIIQDKLSRLQLCLYKYHKRIDIVVAWDSDPRVDGILNTWFEGPYFTHGRARLFRHR